MTETTLIAIDDKYVMARFVEAAQTMRKLPPVRVQGYKCQWPNVLYDAHEVFFQEGEQPRLGPANTKEVTRMDETLEWLRLVDAAQRRLIWMRGTKACGSP
jgi:hypothetical protein